MYSIAPSVEDRESAELLARDSLAYFTDAVRDPYNFSPLEVGPCL